DKGLRAVSGGGGEGRGRDPQEAEQRGARRDRGVPDELASAHVDLLRPLAETVSRGARERWSAKRLDGPAAGAHGDAVLQVRAEADLFASGAVDEAIQPVLVHREPLRPFVEAHVVLLEVQGRRWRA